MKIVKSVGGLGSQMMAFALFYSLKKKYKDKVIYDDSWFSFNQQHNGSELNRIFKIEEEKSDKFVSNIINSPRIIFRFLRKILQLFKVYKLYYKVDHNYHQEVFQQKGNVVFYQCWTSEKYFKNFEMEIKEIFQFPEIKDEKNKEIEKIILSNESVALHVRRGDYLTSEALCGLVDLAYYEKAIKHIEEKVVAPLYIIFSDDTNWCKENLKIENGIFVDWNKKENSYIDMQLMSLCKHNIIPNSSFSWWGAWLNKNPEKTVVAPERWANISTGVELNDMVPDSWTIIKNY